MVGLFRARKKTFPGKILVVGDEPDIVSTVEFRLRLANYSVVTAFSAKEGLERAMADKPDLILVDMNRPGTDGYEVLDRLRSNPTLLQVPVIVLTTRHEDEDITAPPCGASDSLTKPFDFGRLLDRIQIALKEREAPAVPYETRDGPRANTAVKQDTSERK